MAKAPFPVVLKRSLTIEVLKPSAVPKDRLPKILLQVFTASISPS